LEQQPSVVLRQANQSLCSDDPGALATAAFATLDRKTGLLRWSTAGHPSPILVRPDRSITLLDGDGLMFGVDRQATFVDYALQLDIGSALVFYTDGLVEVNRDYFGGLRALEGAVLAEYQESSVEFAENVQRRIFSRTAPSDDSALLFVGVSTLDAAANDKAHIWQFDARDAVAAQRVKRAILWELAAHADRSPEFAAIEIIYGELLSNLVRHTPGPATITLEWHDELPVLHVDDHGPAFQFPSNAPTDSLAESGRGFRLINSCSSKFAVQRIGEKNRVTVALPLSAAESGRRLQVRSS
jgi:anti-sigma regulatory factor (Ser/Thr protein kinase)